MQKKLMAAPWPSTIDANIVAGKTPRLGLSVFDGDTLYWLASLPEEKGRNTIMRYSNGETQSVLPAPYSARSGVQEYGGGDAAINNGIIYFVNAQDQQIYTFDTHPTNTNSTHSQPTALTHTPNIRYGDLSLSACGQWLTCVCEDHNHTPMPQTTARVIHTKTGEYTELVGADFYAYPRRSPCGHYLSWIEWDLPNMPWQSTRLMRAQLTQTGHIINKETLVDDPKQAIFQPFWLDNGTLIYVSDKSNWWNIFTFKDDKHTQITHIDGEFATPLWTLNMRTVAQLDSHTLIATVYQNNVWQLVSVDLNSGQLSKLDTPATDIDNITSNGHGQFAFIGASETDLSNIYIGHQDHSLSTLYPLQQWVNTEDIATPKAITFPTTKNQHAHGFYYAPTHAKIEANSPPPMIVICHGGPTGATSTALNLKIQFWTNRGFAVFDINYRGSTGYGRKYREQLYGNWGIDDVDDVCHAAQYAIENHLAHPQQCFIKGSSAGGYTVLAALAFRDQFSGGVSLYGIGDLSLLATDTHKFEAKYLDTLIAPYPEHQREYTARSPLFHADKIRCPMLIFQGLQDKVVPPEQADNMVAQLQDNEIAVTYIQFEEEGHGFRQFESVKRMLEEELKFYSTIIS